MKEVNHKQLTSNAFVNKLLLSNTKFNDWVIVDESFPGPYYKRFSTILEQALEENSITKDEIVYLLDNHFHVLEHLLELREEDVLFLISLDYRLESLVKHYAGEVHIELARKGVRLDIFMRHADPKVRIEVAKHGYQLDRLINDVDPRVRIEVVKHLYGLNLLVNDKNRNVREEVATQGYQLDLLIQDKDRYVREQVAMHEYGLHYLLHDKNQHVRKIAKRLLLTRDL